LKICSIISSQKASRNFLYLSKGLQGSSLQGRLRPCVTCARDRKVGVQKARAPVTKAMAVTPREDQTKLRLEGGHKTKHNKKSDICNNLKP